MNEVTGQDRVAATARAGYDQRENYDRASIVPEYGKTRQLSLKICLRIRLNKAPTFWEQVEIQRLDTTANREEEGQCYQRKKTTK